MAPWRGHFIVRRALQELSREAGMTDRLAVKGQQDRSHIAMNVDDEVRYWTKHLCVTRKELQSIIDKVGNSAAAVRKELAAKSEKSCKGKTSVI
jgi:hypothetical protein